MPALVIPSPGTDFNIILDFRAVKPLRGPSAPHSMLERAINVPSP